MLGMGLTAFSFQEVVSIALAESGTDFTLSVFSEITLSLFGIVFI